MQNLVRVKITGLNLLRITNKLIEKNIFVTDLIVKPRQIRFTIPENKLQFLDNICKKEHKFYQILHKNGIKQVLFRLPYYFGTMIALILSFCYIFATSLFISSVSVTYKSNLTYDLSSVNTLLKDKGIVAGMNKNKFTINEIQNMIMLEIDSVEGCEVRLNGGNLSICIYPATEKYEALTDDLFSNFDGVITEAEVYSGVLKVKVGDIVSKGDVLIENKNGASGKIKAKVYFTATKIYNQNQQKLIYTGNEYKVRDFLICSKFWVIGKNKCNFSNYLVENYSFYVGKNLFLPILCREIKYREVYIENKVIPFEVVEEEIKKELLIDAKSKITNNSEITNITYSIVNEGDYTRIDCYVETILDLVWCGLKNLKQETLLF